MTNAQQESDAKERRKRLLGAAVSTVAFVVLGFALVPGLAKFRETEEPQAQPLPSATANTRNLPESAPAVDRSLDPFASEGAALDAAPSGGFDCMISPNEVIDISSPITGIIAEIPVERSDTVEAGQVLIRLDGTVETAAVRVARARAVRKVDIQASQASLELDTQRKARAERLFANNALSLDQRQEVVAEAALSVLEVKRAKEDQRLALLQLRQAQAALDRRTILSPVSGIVVDRLMSPGEVVDEETVLRIAEVDPLRVETLLPSSHFGRIERGDRAEITPEPPHDTVRVAEVAIVDRIIDGASGTFGVQLRLANPDQQLPAGLRCTVRFGADE